MSDALPLEFYQHRGVWRACRIEQKYGQTVRRLCRYRDGSIISNDTREGLECVIKLNGEKA